MATLPPETVDRIIDQLHDDRASLAACSLVSSTFVSSARFHLFSELELDYSKISSFLQLLDVPWCTIPPAMGRIIIGQRNTIRPCWYASFVPQDTPSIISRLQGVHSIRFQNTSMSCIPPPFWCLLQSLDGVKKIEFHQVFFGRPIHFFQYVCTRPQLETLSISESFIGTTAFDFDVTQFRPQTQFSIPFLEAAQLSSGTLSWLLGQNPIPHIHTFQIYFDLGPWDSLHQCAESLGTMVQELKIILPADPYAAPDNAVPDIDFTLFTNVQSIHLEGFIKLEPPDVDNPFEDWMRAIFAGMPASFKSLKKVSLTVSLVVDESIAFFGIPDHAIWSVYNWGCLPEILADIHLEEFRVSLRDVRLCQRSLMEKSIRRGPLSSFQANGVLYLEFL